MFDAERVLSAAFDRLRTDLPIGDPDRSMPVP
jgi:hypothetical protein